MPNAATYRRVLTHSIILADLERELIAFLTSVPGVGQSERETLDDKKLRRVVPLENGRGTYLPAVFLPAAGLMLCRVMVNDKSNVIGVH